MSSQMRTFLIKLAGYIRRFIRQLASVFSSTGTGGGQEADDYQPDYPAHHADGDCADWPRRQELIVFRVFRGGTPQWRTTPLPAAMAHDSRADEESVHRPAIRGEYAGSGQN